MEDKVIGMQNVSFIHQASHLIGIAGASCSGKSTLANTLAAKIEGAAVIPMDAYYRDLAHLSPTNRARFNFDAPEALDHELLLTHLRALKHGDTVDIPEYDYSTHSRAPATRPIAPTAWIILEGLYAFYWESIRALLDTSVFIETPLELCLERRIARDTHERGRTEASVREQYASTVGPMYNIHCAPTAQFADIILNGDGPVEEAAARVMTRL